MKFKIKLYHFSTFFHSEPQVTPYPNYITEKAMFTRNRSQMDSSRSWNGLLLFTRDFSVYENQATWERSVTLDRSEQLSLTVTHSQTKLSAKRYPSLNCAASTERNRSRCLHGNRTTETVPKLEPNGNRLALRLPGFVWKKKPIRHDFYIESFGTGPVWTQPKMFLSANGKVPTSVRSAVEYWLLFFSCFKPGFK